MFEHAILEPARGPRRALATGAGFAGQAALAASLVLAPLIWPQVLPTAKLSMSLIAPAPVPPAPPAHIAAAQPRNASPTVPIFDTRLIPTYIPKGAPPIADTVGPMPDGPTVLGGFEGPREIGLLTGLIKSTLPAAPPKPEVVTKKIETTSEPKRIHVSRLEPGKLLHMVQPVYPQPAKTVRIEGTVELRAVIGTDGRVKEVTIVSGHPLLRRAAQEAVAQWIYKPPVLNGESVEIVAPIEVVFRLN